MEKSLVDYAYDVLAKHSKPMTFKSVFDQTVKAAKLSLDDSQLKTKMSRLYTVFTVDGRFVSLPGGLWDLKERYSFEVSHKNIDDLIVDDESEEDEDDEEEKKLLNEELGETSDDSNDNDYDDLDFDKPKQGSDEEEEF